MYQLDKCEYEKCTRRGRVAIREGTKFCNLHWKAKQPTNENNYNRNDEKDEE